MCKCINGLDKNCATLRRCPNTIALNCILIREHTVRQRPNQHIQIQLCLYLLSQMKHCLKSRDIHRIASLLAVKELKRPVLSSSLSEYKFVVNISMFLSTVYPVHIVEFKQISSSQNNIIQSKRNYILHLQGIKSTF